MASDPHDLQRASPPAGTVLKEPREVRGYFVQVPLPRPEDGLDLRVIWRQVVRYRAMIAMIILAPMALAAIVVSLMKPVYRSDVVLVPATTDEAMPGLSSLTSQFGGLAAIVGLSTPATSSKEQTIAILQSKAFTAEFIEAENLLPVLFPSKWDAGAGKWISQDKDDIPTIADGIETFEDDIRAVSDDPSANLVTLSIQWHDPQVAARWATDLIRRLNDDVRKRDIAEAQRSIEFIKRELAKSDNVELRQAMFGLMQQQLEKMVLANVREDYAFKVLDPAYASDIDDYVWPAKIATIAACGVLGLVFAIVAVALRASWQKTRKD